MIEMYRIIQEIQGCEEEVYWEEEIKENDESQLKKLKEKLKAAAWQIKDQLNTEQYYNSVYGCATLEKVIYQPEDDDIESLIEETEYISSIYMIWDEKYKKVLDITHKEFLNIYTFGGATIKYTNDYNDIVKIIYTKSGNHLKRKEYLIEEANEQSN